jgi:hypothetical protein
VRDRLPRTAAEAGVQLVCSTVVSVDSTLLLVNEATAAADGADGGGGGGESGLLSPLVSDNVSLIMEETGDDGIWWWNGDCKPHGRSFMLCVVNSKSYVFIKGWSAVDDTVVEENNVF